MTVKNTPQLMYFWASAILLGLGFSGPALSAQSDQDSFGSQALRTNKQDAVNEIQSTISAINENALGVASLSLSKGRVWRNTDQSRLTIRQGDIMTIEKGVLGAFYLSEVDSNRRIRVRRTQ
jgi:hypothetical protein